MEYLNINEKMLNMRIQEKKNNKFSKLVVNAPNDGFSMLTTKRMTSYVDLLEHVNIVPPEERYWEHKK